METRTRFSSGFFRLCWIKLGGVTLSFFIIYFWYGTRFSY